MISIMIISKVAPSLDGTLTYVATHSSELFAPPNPWMPHVPRSHELTEIARATVHANCMAAERGRM
jgi:hypothetical protein